MPISFHRAFDMSNDLEKSLEDLIDLGFIRVLTSGGTENAFNGMEMIAKLINQADGRLEIMPGAGINPDNISTIATRTGAKNFHSSARVFVKSKMEYRNSKTNMGSVEDEYQYQQTSSELVKEMVEKLG
jgi:copper homeostasis protein